MYGVLCSNGPWVHVASGGLMELLKNLIKVNVEGTTKVTQIILSGMLKRKKKAIVYQKWD